MSLFACKPCHFLLFIRLSFFVALIPISSSACPSGSYVPIQATGSSTTSPVATAWAQHFNDSCLNISIAVRGSTRGYESLCIHQNSDIGMMSRGFKSDEVIPLSDGYTFVCNKGNTTKRFTRLAVARDGVSIIVSRTGNGHTCLSQTKHGGFTFAQLRWIFSNETDEELRAAGLDLSKVVPNDNHDGIKQWSDFSSSSACPSEPIRIHLQASFHGTPGQFFGDICSGCSPWRHANWSIEYPLHDDEILHNVSGAPNAIGLIAYRTVEIEATTYPVDLIRVSPDRVGGFESAQVFVTPSLWSVVDDSYPLARDLVMLVDEDSWGKVRPYFEYVFSNEAFNILKSMRYFWALHLSQRSRTYIGGNPSAYLKGDEHLIADLDPSLVVIIDSVTGVVLFFVFILMCILAYHRQKPILKVASIPMLSVILFGSLLGGISVILMTISPPTNASCNLRWWSWNMALGLILGALTAKNSQLSTLLNSENARHGVNRVGNKFLVKFLAMTISPVIITCTLVSALSMRVQTKTEYIMIGAQQDPPLPWSIVQDTLTCGFEHDFRWTGWVCIIPHVVLIGYSLYWLKQAQHIPHFMNESMHISNALFVLVFVGIVNVLIVTQVETTPSQTITVAGLSILASIVIIDSFIFVPKMLKAFDKHFDFKSELQENMRYRTTMDLARWQKENQSQCQRWLKMDGDLEKELDALLNEYEDAGDDEKAGLGASFKDRRMSQSRERVASLTKQSAEVIHELVNDPLIRMAKSMLRNLGYVITHPTLDGTKSWRASCDLSLSQHVIESNAADVHLMVDGKLVDPVSENSISVSHTDPSLLTEK